MKTSGIESQAKNLPKPANNEVLVNSRIYTVKH